MAGALFFSLLNPIICAALAGTMFVAARTWPRLNQLNYLGASFFAAGAAFAANDLLSAWEGPALRIVVNLSFYLSIVFASFAALTRVHIPIPIARHAVLAAVSFGAFGWFLAIEPSTTARIYTVNATYTLIAGDTIWRLVRAKPQTRTDWGFVAIAALLLIFALVRPIAIAGGLLRADTTIQTGSSYWSTIVAFTPILAFSIALVFFWAVGKQIFDDLRREAEHDFLTGLLNRRGFERKIGACRGAVPQKGSALLIADIDNFKTINDRYGHGKGDEIIQFVAETLRTMNPNTAIARTGGEEFSVFYQRADRHELESIAAKVAAHLCQHKCAHLPAEHTLSLSFGAVIDRSGKTLAEMTSKADSALYQSKAKGKNQISFA